MPCRQHLRRCGAAAGQFVQVCENGLDVTHHVVRAARLEVAFAQVITEGSPLR